MNSSDHMKFMKWMVLMILPKWCWTIQITEVLGEISSTYCEDDISALTACPEGRPKNWFILLSTLSIPTLGDDANHSSIEKEEHLTLSSSQIQNYPALHKGMSINFWYFWGRYGKDLGTEYILTAVFHSGLKKPYRNLSWGSQTFAYPG